MTSLRDAAARYFEVPVWRPFEGPVREPADETKTGAKKPVAAQPVGKETRDVPPPTRINLSADARSY